MWTRVLRRFRELVRRQEYVVTLHAWHKSRSADLMAFDLERLILCGSITARQREGESGEWKYAIEGVTPLGVPAATVVKLSSTDKLVFITVYRL